MTELRGQYWVQACSASSSVTWVKGQSVPSELGGVADTPVAVLTEGDLINAYEYLISTRY